jgi:hypothetical protein
MFDVRIVARRSALGAAGGDRRGRRDACGSAARRTLVREAPELAERLRNRPLLSRVRMRSI